MASKILISPIQITKPSNPFPPTKPPSSLLPPPSLHRHNFHLSSISPTHLHKPKALSLHLHSSLSSSSTTPPSSKEEAIQQAKTCLSTTLEKPLNNLKLAGRIKTQKQPRFRIEIPVLDDNSPESLSQLAMDLFANLSIKRKGTTALKILLLWPNPTLAQAAVKAFEKSHSSNNHILQHLDISSLVDRGPKISTSSDVAVFLVPESSQLGLMKRVCDFLYPKPVVLFNPRWVFEEESDFLGEVKSFVSSFEVVFAFMGLEVKGILNKRKGVVFKCVRDGVLSGEKWNVFVEEEGKERQGELKVVSRFSTRPSIGEVENVLYNLMAINSPITKSTKFLRDLVSNVTGEKQV